MAKVSAKSHEEVEQMIAAYEQSGLTRREYCEQQKIALTSFDYYRHRYRKQAPSSRPLVRVELQESGHAEREFKGFSLVLLKGRRIESSWSYSEQHLARLIRIVEGA